MGIRVEWVRYGRPAAEALRAELAAVKGDDPLAPVTVVVPSNHVGVAARRLLASGELGPVSARGTGLAAVTFVTPYRLAELLGAPVLAGAGRRPVSTPVIAAAFRGRLTDDAGLFAPVAAHPSTEAALVAAYRELREVSPASLDAISKRSERAGDVVRLHRAARAELEADWYDEQDLMAAAADAPLPRDVGHVVVYLPQRISPHGGRMLAAIAERAPLSVVAGTTGDERADAETVAAVRRIAPDAETPPIFDPHDIVGAGGTRLVLASDGDDEVRVAVRAVVDAVRDGVPLDRIAVLYASAEPYARLAHELLGAAGIKTHGPAVVPLAGRVAGRTLLDFLALPERSFRRQDVFSWLASVPLLRSGAWTPTQSWERLSREAGVVAGRADWDERLTRLAGERRELAVACAEDPDSPEWRQAKYEKESTRAEDLRAFVLDLIDDLDEVSRRPRTWDEHATWARTKLTDLLGAAPRRDGWPEPERKAAERVEMALDRLAALDELEDAVMLDVFARTLALELESDLGRVGRFGDGVLVGPVNMGIGLDLDLVIILGLAEGTFPGPVRDDSLLPDDDRRVTDGELPLRQSRVDREHRELLAALAGSTRHVLGVPRGDLRQSREPVPSRWALDLAGALEGRALRPDELLGSSKPWVEHVPSFASDLRDFDFPATEQEHRLRSLLIAAPAHADDLTTVDDAAIAAGAEAMAARRSNRFTRFDGNLAGLEVISPVAGATSATRLQTWAVCPFAYFLEYVLGADEVENPEEALQISALDRGSLVHEALEVFILEVLERPPAEQPSPDQPWPPEDRARLLAIGEELCDYYESLGRTGRPIFWHRDRARILADLKLFLEKDDEARRMRRTRPLAAELAFGGSDASLDAVPIDLPDGRVLRFRGKADRVDVGEDGTIHVVDYKTGSTRNYEGLSADDPDTAGTHLQLAVYGAAARAHQGTPDANVLAEYWFVSTKGRFERRGYPITADIQRRVSATIGAIVGGIEAGLFVSHPDEISTAIWVTCASCDPDGLGTTGLRRAWEAKRADPALARYADLAEPLEGVTPIEESSEITHG